MCHFCHNAFFLCHILCQLTLKTPLTSSVVSLAEALDLSVASIAAPDASRRKATDRRAKTLKGRLGDIAAHDTDADMDSAAAAADSDSDEQAGGIDAFPPNEADAEDAGAADAEAAEDLSVYETLFKGRFFFLSREVPRESLEFVIRAFGGSVGWADEETSPFGENDSVRKEVKKKGKIKSRG